MKIENFGVQEMDSKEMMNLDGGGLIKLNLNFLGDAALKVVAYGAGFLKGFSDGFSKGYSNHTY